MSDHSSKSDKEDRIVNARLRLMERFKKANARPSVPDGEKIQGTGPSNRHGLPQLPPGQTETKKWPVLDLGRRPTISRDAWELVVDGEVEEPINLSFADLLRMEVVHNTSDFHCVTTWSKFDMNWRGVRVSDILARAMPNPGAQHILCYGSDGYTTNLPLHEAVKDDVLLTWEIEGEALPPEHGGPVRMITPQLYAWKGSKWIRRIEVLKEDKKGFWERRGYSNSAFPWTNDRYSR